MTSTILFIILGVLSVFAGFVENGRGREGAKTFAAVVSVSYAILLIVLCILQKYWIGILWTVLIFVIGSNIGASLVRRVLHIEPMNNEQKRAERNIMQYGSEELRRSYEIDRDLKIYKDYNELLTIYTEKLKEEISSRAAKL